MVVEADHGIDLTLDQHGVAQLDVDGHAIDRLHIDLVEREQRRQNLGAGIDAAGAELGARQLLQRLDRLALEAEYDRGEAVEHRHDQLRRLLGVARGELDQRREIGQPKLVGAGRNPGDRLDRAGGAVQSDVDALLAEDAALGTEEQRRIAAIDAEFEAETDGVGALRSRQMWRGEQPRKTRART
jgi:hypothetical protein